MNRGEIWWADLPDPIASEPGYRRPVVIIQSNDFNRSRINTVIAIVITSNTKLAAAPGNVSLSPAKSSLTRTSVANVSQIITLDKQFLQGKVGQLSNQAMQQIDIGVRLVLSL